MLDARLTRVAAFVRHSSRLADIGTDHAHLPVQLVKNGVCTYAIASDVKKGPVAAATRTVSEAELSDKIDIRLGDGLETVSPDEVDDIVIAGMGGETIAKILRCAPWVQNERFRLILQPMTRAEKLRRYLWENGFDILTEAVVQDGRHWYTVIHATYTGIVFMPEELLCHVGRIPLPEGVGYLQTVKNRLHKQKQGDPSADALLRGITEYEQTGGTI
ncbi:MAG: SAM-dependent methyltransferase [Clostridia bacterium]|nr:SAM-dependent methyltransferase [Clostridia bacterium]